jgi:hypothetical protein
MRIAKIAALSAPLAAALSLSACATYPAEDSAMASCPHVSRDWQAWINAMPGPDAKRTLHITGNVDMPTPGYSVKLVEGPADRMQPPGLRFQLEVTPPDGPVTQVITPAEVNYSAPTPYSQIREIMISCGDRPLATITEVPVAQ